MNKKLIYFLMLTLCLIMPIVSFEGITVWMVSIFFIYKSIKVFRKEENIKKVILNTIYCASIILVLNIAVRYTESVLVKMLM